MIYAWYRYSRTQAGKIRRSLRRMRKTLSRRRVLRRVASIDENPSIAGLYVVWKIPYDVAAVEKAQATVGETLAEPNRELFVLGLKNARVKVVEGFVALDDARLLAESAFTYKVQKSLSRKNQFARKPDVRLSGACYTLIGFQWDNYFHWFCDMLPKLYSLTQLNLAEPLTLLIRPDLAAFQTESLRWCLPKNIVVQTVTESDWISVENLVFPSPVRTRVNDYLPPEYLHFLRSAALKHVPHAAAQRPGRRLYISRALAQRRRVVNETEVLTLLDKYGFEVAQPETLPVDEQVRLFHAAEMIVAPHGAGLTNILFAESLTLIEIMMGNPRDDMWCYRRLASMLSHSYHHVPAMQESINADIHVDLVRLEKKLVEIGL